MSTTLTEIGKEYVSFPHIENPTSDRNHPIYEINHSIEEVLASLNPIDEILGNTTKDNYVDLISKPTKWEEGVYRLPGEVLSMLEIARLTKR